MVASFSPKATSRAAHLSMASCIAGSSSFCAEARSTYSWFHLPRFVPKLRHALIIFGSRAVMLKKNGTTMKSAKFIDNSSCFTESLSQFMETANPSFFSLSPCKKNSSMTRSLHFLLASHCLAGLLISAVCRIDFMTTRRSLSTSLGKGSSALRGGASVMFLFTTESSSARRLKCCVISVLRTRAIMFLRKARFMVSSKLAVTFNSVWPHSSKALAQ
mmetsp:Transcript_7516/g.12495  ORF Transcript_7516/g.12495 Transcript_7516/m.12495 type:complete len:217 (-) Transcript_7516:613-1263(-)